MLRIAGDWDGKNEYLVACAGDSVLIYELWPEERGDTPLGEHESDKLFSFIGGAFERVLAEVNRQRVSQGLKPYGGP